MRNLLMVILLASCSASAKEIPIYCNGLTNQNTSISLKLEIDNEAGTIVVDGQKSEFLVADKCEIIERVKDGTDYI